MKGMRIIKKKCISPKVFSEVMDWARESYEDGYKLNGYQYKAVMKK